MRGTRTVEHDFPAETSQYRQIEYFPAVIFCGRQIPGQEICRCRKQQRIAAKILVVELDGIRLTVHEQRTGIEHLAVALHAQGRQQHARSVVRKAAARNMAGRQEHGRRKQGYPDAADHDH
jgi:hypothetical protein